MLKPQMWYFIKVAVTLFEFCTTNMPARAFGQCFLLLQANFCLKGTSRLQPAGGVNLKCRIQRARKRNNISCSQLDKRLNNIDAGCRLEQESRTEKDRKRRVPSGVIVSIMVQRCVPNETATWNDMKFSKIQDRVRCQRCIRYHRRVETFCGCGRMLTGHHRRCQEAGKATNHQSIHRVHSGHFN